MRYALVNPRWSFEGSIYFGCREPHLPLELGYARALLEARGHEVKLVDGQLEDLSLAEIHARVAAFNPDFTVVCTAPSYLFWRCAPPELRVPIEHVRALRDVGATMVVVGPHASTTPRATLRKTGADVCVLGECEEVLAELAVKTDLHRVQGIAWRSPEGIAVQGELRAADLTKLPALRWEEGLLARHRHHHHRFDRAPERPGAELEASRGCPYRCTFCAKENFRDRYRKRPLSTVLTELDALIAAGVEYVYFVDEIFLPDEALLLALAERPVEFGVQMRVDLFDERQLDLLGRAGCVSIEAGVESITDDGRRHLEKRCRASTERLEQLLVHAKKSVPFVQANLIEGPFDRPDDVQAFRDRLRVAGVWANDPVPLFPYPGSPDFRRSVGELDDDAWERAIDWYLARYDGFSELQDARPLPLRALEAS